MSKFLASLTLIGIGVMFALGVAAPNNPAMWLASTTGAFALLRLALIGVLVALIVTNPPRNVYLRIFVGIVSTTIAAWAIVATYQNAMKFLDTFALLAFSITSGLIALELEDFDEEPLLLKQKATQ